MQAAYGVLTERELLAVSITGDDGIAGYGEAAPLEPYDGVGIDRAHEALARYAPIAGAVGSPERRPDDRRVPRASTTSRRRSRRSTSRCGTEPGARAGCRSRRC